jgi:hypothetical protein
MTRTATPLRTTAGTGGSAVTVDGTTHNPAQGKDVSLKGLTRHGRLGSMG